MKKNKLMIISLIIYSCVTLNSCGLFKPNLSSSENNIGNTSSEIEEESTVMSAKEKERYYEGTNSVGNDYETPYGVGRAVNALEDPYIEVTNALNQIFDASKITSIKWIKTELRQQEAEVISETSTSSFKESFSTSIGRKASANVGVEGMFTAGLETDFKIENSFHVNQNTKEILTKYSQNINGFKIEIEGYKDYRNFYNLLSDKLYDDIVKLENGTITPSEFISFYGTHVVMAGYYGGRLEFNYHLLFDSSEISDEMMVSYAAKASASIEKAQISASASAEENFSIKNELGITEESKDEYISFKGRGGRYIEGGSIEEFMTKYPEWVSSFNDQEETYSVLVDVPNSSLMPIWYLFPEEYSNAKTLVANEFQMQATNKYNEWLEKCAYIYDDTTVNDTFNYAGGAGTEINPYKIANYKHLMNISKNMNSHFELVNDIDISGINNWEPIGGRNLENLFNGSLDGKGFKINGLTRTQDVPEINNRSYFGLFGGLGTNAKVENIDFSNINILIKGPGNNNGNMRAFFGVVAGKSEGIISNITTDGSYVYNCCTNGETWLGGIVGYSVNSKIINCVNNIDLKSDRYSTFVGGIVAYSQGGTIEGCTNNGNILAIGTDWGGLAYAGLIGAETYTTDPTILINNIANGVAEARAYDNSNLFGGCTCKVGKTDFASRNDVTF